MRIYEPRQIPMALIEDWCFGQPYRVLKNNMLFFEEIDWIIYYNSNKYMVVSEAVARRYLNESFIVRPRRNYWLVL